MACEHQLARGGASPLFDPPLKGARLTIGENAGDFALEACEEFLADTIRFGPEPCAHARPDGRERIPPGFASRAPAGARVEGWHGSRHAATPKRGP